MADRFTRISSMVDELEQLLEAALSAKPAPRSAAPTKRAARAETSTAGPRITGTGAPAVSHRAVDEDEAIHRSPSGTLHGVAAVSPTAGATSSGGRRSSGRRER